MSFSGQVKEELCKAPVQKKTCAAECYGVLLFCNAWTGREVRIVTESEAFARRLPMLLRRAFHMEFDRRPEPEAGGKRVFAITAPEKLAALEALYGGAPGRTVARTINFAVLEEEDDRRAFCRGAFLAGGAVTDPGKDYHMEWVTTHIGVGRAFPVILRELGFEAKQVTRKSNYVTYAKHSDTIADLLVALGAGGIELGMIAVFQLAGEIGLHVVGVDPLARSDGAGGVADGEAVFHHLVVFGQAVQRHFVALGNVRFGGDPFKHRPGGDGLQGHGHIVLRVDVDEFTHMESSSSRQEAKAASAPWVRMAVRFSMVAASKPGTWVRSRPHICSLVMTA